MVAQFLVFKDPPYFSALWLHQFTIPILILDVSNTRTFLDHFSCEHCSHLLQAFGGGPGAWLWGSVTASHSFPSMGLSAVSTKPSVLRVPTSVLTSVVLLSLPVCFDGPPCLYVFLAFKVLFLFMIISVGFEERVKINEMLLQPILTESFMVLPPWSRTFLVAQMVKRLPAMWETWVWSLGGDYPLEKEMATHSSTLAWKIPWTEEAGRLQSTGLQRVGHDWATSFDQIFCRKSGAWPFQT